VTRALASGSCFPGSEKSELLYNKGRLIAFPKSHVLDPFQAEAR
jgi:hypothetical protein